MRKALLIYMAIVSILASDELKMKEVNQLLYDAQNKILIIDKKDLDGFIAENNKKAQEEADARAKEKLRASVPEEIVLNLGVQPIIDDTPPVPSSKPTSNAVSHEPMTPAVAPIVEKAVDKKVFSVDSVEKYKEFISLKNKSEYDIRYSLKLRELLEITKYVFSKNLDKEYYPEIKSLLLSESTSNKKIEKGIFVQSLDEMNYDIATEMLSEFSSPEE